MSKKTVATRYISPVGVEAPPPRLPRVFIIQQPRPNPKKDNWTPSFDAATQYGGLRFIFDASDRAHLDPTTAQETVRQELKDFDPEQDFLLPTIFGDPAATWVTLLWLAPFLKSQGHRYVTFLYWSRGKGDEGMTNENGYYMPCKIPL